MELNNCIHEYMPKPYAMFRCGFKFFMVCLFTLSILFVIDSRDGTVDIYVYLIGLFVFAVIPFLGLKSDMAARGMVYKAFVDGLLIVQPKGGDILINWNEISKLDDLNNLILIDGRRFFLRGAFMEKDKILLNLIKSKIIK